MSTSARIFFVSSIIITGVIFYGVNYYIEDEKQRKRTNILRDIERRNEKHRLNMEIYERQLKIDEKLRQN